MGMTLLEKIIAAHSKLPSVKPGEIVDIDIDSRVARDFGGANVVKNIKDFGLGIENPDKTFFTFDCNPTGSDQKYAVNQHICRIFARENGIRVFDIDSGIGTHILIDEGFVYPGSTAVSTDSHANILGAVGAFGQGMGDMDIAATWNNGKIWFKVPESVRIDFIGDLPPDITAKDFVLNLLKKFGANSLLGFSIEVYGKCIDKLTIDQRITISSMATEMGAIIILFPPDKKVIDYCRKCSGTNFIPVFADTDALYTQSFEINVSEFVTMISRPGEPHDAVAIESVEGTKIDSAFIGSCTNGRMEDMKRAADILRNKKTAPGVILKIVPATDKIWNQCMEDGLIDIFKKAGALVSNAGCAGCAAGQVGQNGPGEVTISTGNRNFPGKQGKGSVYLASPDVVAASAVAGYITTPDRIPEVPAPFLKPEKVHGASETSVQKKPHIDKPETIEGNVWIVQKDNIDTDMIFHNRYLSITNVKEMGQYTFDNLKGFESFAKQVKPGDFVIAGKNFGSGSSRQQAVDCFISLGIAGIIAESFGSIYERNAINAGFPIITCSTPGELGLQNGDKIKVNLRSGEIVNISKGNKTSADPFSDVQIRIYQKGNLLG